jgi:hypothetical protein
LVSGSNVSRNALLSRSGLCRLPFGYGVFAGYNQQGCRRERRRFAWAEGTGAGALKDARKGAYEDACGNEREEDGRKGGRRAEGGWVETWATSTWVRSRATRTA